MSTKNGTDKMPTTEKSPDEMPTTEKSQAFCILSYHQRAQESGHGVDGDGGGDGDDGGLNRKRAVGNRTVAAISASSSQDRKRTPLLIITTHKPTTLPLWHCKKLPKRLSLGGAHNKRVIFPAIIVGNQQKLKSSSRR